MKYRLAIGRWKRNYDIWDRWDLDWEIIYGLEMPTREPLESLLPNLLRMPGVAAARIDAIGEDGRQVYTEPPAA